MFSKFVGSKTSAKVVMSISASTTYNVVMSWYYSSPHTFRSLVGHYEVRDPIVFYEGQVQPPAPPSLIGSTFHTSSIGVNSLASAPGDSRMPRLEGTVKIFITKATTATLTIS